MDDHDEACGQDLPLTITRTHDAHPEGRTAPGNMGIVLQIIDVIGQGHGITWSTVHALIRLALTVAKTWACNKDKMIAGATREGYGASVISSDDIDHGMASIVTHLENAVEECVDLQNKTDNQRSLGICAVCSHLVQQPQQATTFDDQGGQPQDQRANDTQRVVNLQDVNEVLRQADEIKDKYGLDVYYKILETLKSSFKPLQKDAIKNRQALIKAIDEAPPEEDEAMLESNETLDESL